MSEPSTIPSGRICQKQDGGWLDGWVVGWIGGWLDGWVVGWMGG